MDYPCGKFGDCSFSCFGSITQTDADVRYTPATVVGVSSNYCACMMFNPYFHELNSGTNLAYYVQYSTRYNRLTTFIRVSTYCCTCCSPWYWTVSLSTTTSVSTKFSWLTDRRRRLLCASSPPDDDDDDDDDELRLNPWDWRRANQSPSERTLSPSPSPRTTSLSVKRQTVDTDIEWSAAT